MEIFSLAEEESLIDDPDDKERESNDHNKRECYVRIGMYFPIVSEHDLYICEGPPEITSEENEEDEYEAEVSVREWFQEVGEHMCWRVGGLESWSVRGSWVHG